MFQGAPESMSTEPLSSDERALSLDYDLLPHQI